MSKSVDKHNPEFPGHSSAVMGLGKHDFQNGKCKTFGQKVSGSGSKVYDANDGARTNDGPGINNGKRDANDKIKGNQSCANLIKAKKSFAGLFKDNRIANESSMLNYIDPPEGEMELGFDEIDTVEEAFGYCLVGFVMGLKPSPYVLRNFVKRWGSNVNFIFKGNGWIKFQFTNELERDSVLNGGPYMILGRQLFLKKLTSCFLFSKEDMVSLSSWVQIHGLPADCWTTKVLSRIASVVGKPIHTDKLTISKKGEKYARVLVEMDALKSRIMDYTIKLPTGKRVLLKFIYESEPKFCDKCNGLGHTMDMCNKVRNIDGNMGRDHADDEHQRDESCQGDQTKDGNTMEDSLDHHNKGLDTSGVKEKLMKDDSNNHDVEDVTLGNLEDKAPDYNDDIGDENSVQDMDDRDFLSDEFELACDDGLSCVVPQDKEEWIKVGKKKRRFVNKYMRKGVNDHKNKDSGSSSAETEYVPMDPRSMLPLKGGPSIFLKRKLVEVRLPKR